MANKLITLAEAAKSFKEAIEAGLAECETEKDRHEFLDALQDWLFNIPMRDTSDG